MCACTEPVRAGIGAVCVEYGLPKRPITMLNHTDIPGTEKCFYFLLLAPYACTTRCEEAFLPLKAKKNDLIISRTQNGIYIIVVALERREEKHTRSSQENKGDHHLFQVSTKNIPIGSSGNPQIQLHRYDDTEHESISSTAPPLSAW